MLIEPICRYLDARWDEHKGGLPGRADAGTDHDSVWVLSLQVEFIVSRDSLDVVGHHPVVPGVLDSLNGEQLLIREHNLLRSPFFSMRNSFREPSGLFGFWTSVRSCRFCME
jgi:hypothetical protein